MKKKLSIVVVIIGIVLLVLSFNEYKKYDNEKNSYGVVEATVNEVKINDNRTTVGFEYYLNEKYYFSSVVTEEEFKVGSKYHIFYLKNNPNISKIHLITIYKSMVFLGCGCLILLIGLVLQSKYILINMRIKKLKKKGIMVKANIQEVLVVNKSNGKNPYRIRALYNNPQNSKDYMFISEEEKEDLKDLVTRNNIKTINVYINPRNTEDYYVDIESIKI